MLSPIRIAIVHTPARTGTLTGEDLAAEAQAAALAEAGHEVLRLSYEPPLKITAAGVTSLAGRNLGYVTQINAARADVVHLHKWHPWLGRRDFAAILAPMVATLHNFRPLCPVGTLFREGQLCIQCVQNRPVPLVRHACFRGSHLGSLGVALGRPSRGDQHPFLSRPRVLIAPSERAAALFTTLGDVPESRVQIIPSFVDVLPQRPLNLLPEAGRHWLYVGQLEPTKGIDKLIEAWPATESLTVVGSGSLESKLKGMSGGRDIRFMGRQSQRTVRNLMASSLGLLFPSVFLETQGLVVGEAASVGLPVIALAGTAGADQVSSGGFGVVAVTIDEMIAALRRVRQEHSRLSAAGLVFWSSTLSKQSWVARVTALYEGVIGPATGEG